MHYSSDTFALYESLFKEAFEQVKTAAPDARQALSWWQRFRTPKAVLARLEQQGAALEGAAKAHGTHAQQIKDLAAQHESALRAATDESAAAVQQAAEARDALSRVGTNPEQVNRMRLYGKLGLGATALGAVGAPTAYYIGKQRGEENKRLTRNLAFGAGAATGMAVPHVIRGLGQVAGSMGNTGLFPDVQQSLIDVGGYNGQ